MSEPNQINKAAGRGGDSPAAAVGPLGLRTLINKSYIGQRAGYDRRRTAFKTFFG